MANSELSQGGYVTAYDKLEMPNYMVYLPSKIDFIVDIDVEEEINNRVNGGDSDDCGGDARYFDNTTREVKLDRSCF